MAHFRQRPNGVEVTIKRTGVLPKPLVFTVPTMEEAQERAQRLEAQLDNGILPPAVYKSRPIKTITHLIDEYLHEAHPSIKDQQCLGVISRMNGKTPLEAISASWVDDWISMMKRKEKLKPSSIRARVGALARCTDWGMRKKYLMLPDHPLRTLPDGYSQYSASDTRFTGGETIADEARERRLEPGEYEKILNVFDVGVIARKERPLVLPYPKALRCIFILALETAMRMREMYTLTLDQVDLAKRTIFLDKTKNGDRRQVPLSSVAMELLTSYMPERIAELKSGEPRAADDKSGNLLFPWWDGKDSLHSLGSTSDYLSRTFRSVFDGAGAEGLKFHDLRHEAVSRLFERTTLSETAIMKISGHKSHKMVMRYANLRGSNLADSLW